MFEVKLWITTHTPKGIFSEQLTFESAVSLRSAKLKTSRWIRKNYFCSDLAYSEITKETLSTKRARYTLTFYAEGV